MEKTRLDDLLVQRGLAADRKEATAIILSGAVLVEEQRVDKAGTRVDSSSEIRIKGKPQKYVSRAGDKLEAALRDLGVDARDKVCMDLGASTGGFTDCLLQHGALKVYAFDVGRGLLHWKLQQDSRVVVRDAVNVRYIDPSHVAEPIDLITMDLSFISLRLILPALKEFRPVQILALVKPQFEARPDEVGPGGIIESLVKQREILDRIKEFAAEVGFTVLGELPSPVPGRQGNQEYFLLLKYDNR